MKSVESIQEEDIKYYPDRFYIRLDGFDLNNLTSFLHDLDIKQHQAIFIHEYYHYLTNITTFPGIRQFHLNFCDRFRLVTILASKAGLDAFPVSQNKLPCCTEEVAYWKSVGEIIDSDDINFNLAKETEQSQNKSFEIVDILPDETKTSDGIRKFVNIKIAGLVDIQQFRLTFGAIDEFLSSSIDEFLYQNSFSEIDPKLLNQRHFYPYRFFDKLLAYYGITYVSAFDKILIAYVALNSFNPSVKLIQILEGLKNGGYEEFQKDPEKYLLKNFSETPQYKTLLDRISDFSKETYSQKRKLVSQALAYYHDKFYTAQKLKEHDFFYFIRPFFQTDKQGFLLSLSRIINQFTPPVILQDGVFHTVDKLTNFGEATTLILATYEILESLKTKRIAQRPPYLKARYIFPDKDTDCDNIQKFHLPPITVTFQLAVNEISLLPLYLEEKERLSK